MAREFKEVAALRTNLNNYGPNYDGIDWSSVNGKKKEVKKDIESDTRALLNELYKKGLISGEEDIELIMSHMNPTVLDLIIKLVGEIQSYEKRMGE